MAFVNLKFSSMTWCPMHLFSCSYHDISLLPESIWWLHHLPFWLLQSLYLVLYISATVFYFGSWQSVMMIIICGLPPLYLWPQFAISAFSRLGIIIILCRLFQLCRTNVVLWWQIYFAWAADATMRLCLYQVPINKNWIDAGKKFLFKVTWGYVYICVYGFEECLWDSWLKGF